MGPHSLGTRKQRVVLRSRTRGLHEIFLESFKSVAKAFEGLGGKPSEEVGVLKSMRERKETPLLPCIHASKTTTCCLAYMQARELDESVVALNNGTGILASRRSNTSMKPKPRRRVCQSASAIPLSASFLIKDEVALAWSRSALHSAWVAVHERS